jgi:hypothetical protein
MYVSRIYYKYVARLKRLACIAKGEFESSIQTKDDVVLVMGVR